MAAVDATVSQSAEVPGDACGPSFIPAPVQLVLIMGRHGVEFSSSKGPFD